MMHPEQVKALRALSAAQKLALAARFWFAARELKACGLKAMHPEWSDERIRQTVKDQFLRAAG